MFSHLQGVLTPVGQGWGGEGEGRGGGGVGEREGEGLIWYTFSVESQNKRIILSTIERSSFRGKNVLPLATPVGWCIGKCPLYKGVLYSECPLSASDNVFLPFRTE